MATSRATGRALARRLLEVSDLRKHYHARAGLLASLHGQTRSVPAVDGVSFALTEHETLGLVGESGCGKTTIGRIILWVTRATSTSPSRLKSSTCCGTSRCGSDSPISSFRTTSRWWSW